MSYLQKSYESDLRCMMIYVPLPSVLPLGSFVILKLLAAEDSQICYSSSSFLDTTVTLLAARKVE